MILISFGSTFGAMIDKMYYPVYLDDDAYWDELASVTEFER